MQYGRKRCARTPSIFRHVAREKTVYTWKERVRTRRWLMTRQKGRKLEGNGTKGVTEIPWNFSEWHNIAGEAFLRYHVHVISRMLCGGFRRRAHGHTGSGTLIVTMLIFPHVDLWQMNVAPWVPWVPWVWETLHGRGRVNFSFCNLWNGGIYFIYFLLAVVSYE